MSEPSETTAPFSMAGSPSRSASHSLTAIPTPVRSPGDPTVRSFGLALGLWLRTPASPDAVATDRVASPTATIASSSGSAPTLARQFATYSSGVFE